MRVRNARVALINEIALGHMRFAPLSKRVYWKLLQIARSHPVPTGAVFLENTIPGRRWPLPSKEERVMIAFAQAASMLASYDRYELRAFVRRQHGLRDLDAIRETSDQKYGSHKVV